MNIAHAYGAGKLGISFELYPPKTDAGDAALFQAVEQLMALKPDYITCTYGAGGSTRSKTLDVIQGVHDRFQVPVASHLTCVGSTKDELRGYLKEAWSRGIENIVALRGDPPKGETSFTAVDGGLHYANELVELIHTEFPEFGIAVAGYPEVHQEALSPQADLDHLKRKVDAGADAILTQLFYINDDYFRFRDQCSAAGINIPLVPGILPVTNGAQIQRIASLCKAKLPEDFLAKLNAQQGNEQGEFDVGVEFATQQVAELLAHDVPGIHFYVLNKAEATSQVLKATARA